MLLKLNKILYNFSKFYLKIHTLKIVCFMFSVNFQLCGQRERFNLSINHNGNYAFNVTF